MTPRIIDIAKEAGVSPAAVSLTLNNKPGVGSDVKQKIMAIAARMGYRTGFKDLYINDHINIRLLKIAKHGHIINERHNSFITEYLEGIETAARLRHYKLEVSFFNHVPIEEIVTIQKGSAVDGLIVLGTELNAHELSFFTSLSVPVVFIDTYFPLSVYDCIDMDNADGVFRAIQYLYNCGHRNIGLVKSTYETKNFKMREAGFQEAMDYFSLPVQKKNIVSIDPAFEQAVIGMNVYLNKNNKMPTAFFCMNDIIAYGCMKGFRDRGYTIPDDVSIIGFDDLPSSSITDPPLTSVRVSTHKIGQRALEKLAERIFKPEENIPENILISGKIVIRDSVKKI
ncbi:MAG: LacI family DNA-binding transcriptional regulator [Treponema sp.]|jgi:LacI family transcriptional regulator|nr:LacI family DNA-binding transcriptional regulator [Treponema sp.]